jgi:hypothetical protein
LPPGTAIGQQLSGGNYYRGCPGGRACAGGQGLRSAGSSPCARDLPASSALRRASPSGPSTALAASRGAGPALPLCANSSCAWLLVRGAGGGLVAFPLVPRRVVVRRWYDALRTAVGPKPACAELVPLSPGGGRLHGPPTQPRGDRGLYPPPDPPPVVEPIGGVMWAPGGARGVPEGRRQAGRRRDVEANPPSGSNLHAKSGCLE